MNPILKESILKLIDRNTWKHSFHMKKNPYGEIDFNDENNRKTIREQIQEAHREADALKELAIVCSHFNGIQRSDYIAGYKARSEREAHNG